MKRSGHFKTFDLSDDARAIVHEGFLRHAMLKTILARVQEATGETLTPSALQRYRVWWRSEHRAAEEARQYAQEIAASLKDHPAEDVRRFIEQKLEQLFLMKLKGLEGKDPLDVSYLSLAARKVAVKEREVALTARKVAALEERVEALTAQAKKAKEAVDRAVSKKSLRPEDLREIRERVYGITG